MAAAHEAAVPATATATVGAVLNTLEIPSDIGSEDNVVAIHFVPQTAQSAQGATNHSTLQVRDVSSNTTAPVVLGSINFGTQAATAETNIDMTLAAQAVKLGDVLDVYLAQTGTGGACPAGRLVIEVQ
jgi:hypothetical protein